MFSHSNLLHRRWKTLKSVGYRRVYKKVSRPADFEYHNNILTRFLYEYPFIHIRTYRLVGYDGSVEKSSAFPGYIDMLERISSLKTNTGEKRTVSRGTITVLSAPSTKCISLKRRVASSTRSLL